MICYKMIAMFTVLLSVYVKLIRWLVKDMIGANGI